METGVSVVICCYNSSNKIGGVLEHLQNQTDTKNFNWEVIVVDNNSMDNTAVVAKDTWNRTDVKLHIVFETNPGLSNARLKGIATSAYSILVFVDDDNLVSEDYISRSFQIMNEHPNVGLAGGIGIAVSQKELPVWFPEFQGAYAVGPQGTNKGANGRAYLHGAGLVMQKAGWNYITGKGFNFLLSGRKGKSMSSGEDFEISSAFKFAGYELWYDPELRFEHLIPDDRLEWNYVKKLAFQFGKAYVVLQVYIIESKNKQGWEKIKSYNWLIGTLVSLYNLIKMFPDYMWLNIKKIPGSKKEYDFLFNYGYFTYRLRLPLHFARMRDTIINYHETLGKNYVPDERNHK